MPGYEVHNPDPSNRIFHQLVSIIVLCSIFGQKSHKHRSQVNRIHGKSLLEIQCSWSLRNGDKLQRPSTEDGDDPTKM